MKNLFRTLTVGIVVLACENVGPWPRPTTYAIFGTVNGAITSGVTLALAGSQNASTTTDASGHYSFPGLANGSYTITPSRAGYAFAPTRLSPTVNNSDVTRQDFTATAALSSITVAPAVATVAAGYVRQLTATGRYADGSTEDISASATWSLVEQSRGDGEQRGPNHWSIPWACLHKRRPSRGVRKRHSDGARSAGVRLLRIRDRDGGRRDHLYGRKLH